MKNFLTFFSDHGSLIEWLNVVGTLSASFLAVYFGAIRPMQQRAKFKIHPVAKSTYHSCEDYSKIGEDGDMVRLGFFVEQISGAPSNSVNILVKKIWYWDEKKVKEEWGRFVPSNLSWAAKDISFSKGVKRYCYLGSYGDSPSNDFVGCVFDLATTENQGDPFFDSFSSILPDSKKYEIEFVISGENVKVREFKIKFTLNDPRAMGPIGKDGFPEGVKLIDAIEI